MNVLITGGAGNIGSALANSLSNDSNTNLVVVDNLTTGDIYKVPQSKNVSFIKANVNN